MTSALPVELIGMNSKTMCTYIAASGICADRLLLARREGMLLQRRRTFDWIAPDLAPGQERTSRSASASTPSPASAVKEEDDEFYFM